MNQQQLVQSLQNAWTKWQQQPSPEHAQDVLANAGYIRYSLLSPKQRETRASIEAKLRENLEQLIANYSRFSWQPLFEKAQNLLMSHSNQQLAQDFLFQRDQAEAAFQVVKEYSQEELPANATCLGTVRESLDQIDEAVIFNQQLRQLFHQLSEQLPEAVARKKYIQDIFWWFANEEKLPEHFQALYLSLLVKNNLDSQSMPPAFQEYLLRHPELQEEAVVLQKIEKAEHQETANSHLKNLYEILKVSHHQNLAAAKHTEEIPLYQAIWLNKDNKWRVDLFLSPQPEREISFFIESLEETLGADWILQIGELKLPIEEGAAFCKRETLEQNLQNQQSFPQQIQIINQVTNRQIDLYYQENSHE